MTTQTNDRPRISAFPKCYLEALAAGEMSYAGGVHVRHFLDVVVTDLGEKAVGQCVSRPLAGRS